VVLKQKGTIMDQNKLEKISQLADRAGLHKTVHDKYSLSLFFDVVVEECARAAAAQTASFSGAGNEEAGVLKAAAAVRDYGRRPQGAEKRKCIIAPGR
jgi:hypothetical protein